jgi:hypothetical protein
LFIDLLKNNDQAFLVGSVTKMKQLLNNKITFEHDTNVRRWTKEWAAGVTVGGKPRGALQNRTSGELNFYLPYQNTGLENEGIFFGQVLMLSIDVGVLINFMLNLNVA